jgi:hypothetical protein
MAKNQKLDHKMAELTPVAFRDAPVCLTSKHPFTLVISKKKKKFTKQQRQLPLPPQQQQRNDALASLFKVLV